MHMHLQYVSCLVTYRLGTTQITNSQFKMGIFEKKSSASLHHIAVRQTFISSIKQLSNIEYFATSILLILI